MVYSEYWDYRDSLSSSTIKELINNAKQWEISVVEALYNHAIDYDWLSYDNEIFKLANQYMDEYCNSVIDADDLAILDTVRDYMIDSVIGENCDDRYNDLSVWIDAHEEFEEKTQICDDTIKQIENTTIGWLVKSQGYNVVDIFTNKDDEFCKQVYSELFEYISELSGLQLIALPNTTDFDAVLDLYKNKSVIIKKGTIFGLFNQIHGSGTGLEIKTVKDIELNDKVQYDIDIEYHDSSYHYSPNCVYGYITRPNKEQLERVGENVD